MSLLSNVFFDICQNPPMEELALTSSNPFFVVGHPLPTHRASSTASSQATALELVATFPRHLPLCQQRQYVEQLLAQKSIREIEALLTELGNHQRELVRQLEALAAQKRASSDGWVEITVGPEKHQKLRTQLTQIESFLTLLTT